MQLSVSAGGFSTGDQAKAVIFFQCHRQRLLKFVGRKNENRKSLCRMNF
jgi:hypothetical protein